MNVLIRPEIAADHAAVRNVNCQAFGGDAEAQLVDAVRAADLAIVSVVAQLPPEQGGEVVGYLLFSPVLIHASTGTVPALSLAPMAVLPEQQRRGIGTQLVAAGLNACRDAGHTAVLVLGHPDYYPRFGFSAALAEHLESPFGGGDAWMGLELVPGVLQGLAGRVEYSPPFRMFE